MLVDRIIGVFKLNVATFEEIEADKNATSQAAIVVVLVALLAAIGSGIGATVADGDFFGGFLGTLIATLVGWALTSAIIYFVGTALFQGTADFGEMLRVIGFAYAPQLLGIIPCIGALVGAIWSFVAMFIAVRQGLDLDNTRSCLTILGAIVVYAVIYAILGALGLGVALLGGLL